ncbi:MAG TPA: Flp family type IVb pilin [Limnobacter sp.]|nr:Flp family type IVb pilin [Limnobacter sp.]
MSKVAKRQLVLKRKQDGASLIEYAVIAALVVALAVAGFATLGGGLETAFDNIVNALTGAGS